MEEKNFLDELLMEVESRESEQQLAYCDMLILRAKELKEKMEKNLRQAEEEKRIIETWLISKNLELEERYGMIIKKLEMIMTQRGEKTIDLPHGVMKIRKMPDRVEIEDLEVFMKNAGEELVTVIPEQIRADLQKIKQYIKRTQRIPAGVKYIEGREEFRLKIKEEDNNDTKSQT
jgi:hypothetical protein